MRIKDLPLTTSVSAADFLVVDQGTTNPVTRRATLASALGQNAQAEVLTSVSGVDTITATSAQAFTDYAAGQRFQFGTAGANTGAVTLAVNGLAAKAVVAVDGTALTAGALPAGTWVTVEYNGTAFTVLGYHVLRSSWGAGAVGNTPAGGIAATTVQGALNELDTEKISFTRLDDSDGSSLVGFLQAGTGAVTRTAQSKMRDVVSVLDFGADPTGATDSTAAIQAAEDACATSGQALWFPAGTYRCNSGITKKSVNWYGAGKYKSKLAYYGNATFINATGTSPDRRLFTISDMELNGTNAGASAKGVTLGWNMRSTPLVRVHIYNFGHYGIHFNDQNWIVDFYDVEVDTCGRSTSNSSGIFKDAAIDSGTWNAISFYNLTVEACGTASSAAGGINLQTTSANRGLYFYSACVEGNYGTAEIYITNMADCQFNNLYMEVVSAQATNAVELSGVQGGFTGGYITGDDIVANLVGVKIRAGSAFVPNRIEFDKVTIRNFAKSIDAESAIVWTNQIYGDRTFANLSGSAQWFGDYAPRFSAYKSSAQSVNSGAFTKINFETEVYDLTGAFSGSTFTPNAIGTYQVDASINWLAASDQDRLILSIYVNGAGNKTVVSRASGTGEQSVQISAQIRTAAITDTIEIYARQDSGSPQSISTAANETYFMAHLIGRTA